MGEQVKQTPAELRIEQMRQAAEIMKIAGDVFKDNWNGIAATREEWMTAYLREWAKTFRAIEQETRL